jgi:hypothetical protein
MVRKREELPSLDDALRSLNEAAYLAARVARYEADGRAADLKSIALKSDDLLEGKASPAPVPAAFASGA